MHNKDNYRYIFDLSSMHYAKPFAGIISFDSKQPWGLGTIISI